MFLGHFDKSARAYGLTRLSEESGIARPYIHRILSGKSSPSLRILEKLLTPLGLTIAIKEEKVHLIDLAEINYLKLAMAHYGAPLIVEFALKESVRTLGMPSLIEVIIAALQKGRNDAEINAVLPTFIDKNIEEVNLDLVIDSFEDRQYLGYLLDILYTLTSNRKYVLAISRLDIHELRTKNLIRGRTKNKFQKAFFARCTNPIAKAWKFKTGDSFESIKQRFVKWRSGDLYKTRA